jgi:hypothetical protein
MVSNATHSLLNKTADGVVSVAESAKSAFGVGRQTTFDLGPPPIKDAAGGLTLHTLTLLLVSGEGKGPGNLTSLTGPCCCVCRASCGYDAMTCCWQHCDKKLLLVLCPAAGVCAVCRPAEPLVVTGSYAGAGLSSSNSNCRCSSTSSNSKARVAAARQE